MRRQPRRQACASIKESRARALKDLPDGFYRVLRPNSFRFKFVGPILGSYEVRGRQAVLDILDGH